MKKYMVALAYSRGRFNELYYKKSNTIEELKQEVREFIEENEVLSSEWEGGQVYNLANKELVGIIAYNGKYFNKEDAKKYGLK